MAVYAIQEERARLRRVRVGARNERDAWVLEGLTEGTRVVVYPGNEVRDGIRLRVRDVAQPP